MVQGHDDEPHQGGEHGHDDADHAAVEKAVPGGAAVLTGIAPLPVGLGHQDPHQPGQKLVQHAEAVGAREGPQVPPAHRLQPLPQNRQAEIHPAESEDVEEDPEHHAQDSLEEIRPHHGVHAPQNRVDNEDGGEQEDDGQGVRAGEHGEDLAEGLPLASHPGHHDAGPQNAAQHPG